MEAGEGEQKTQARCREGEDWSLPQAALSPEVVPRFLCHGDAEEA